MKKFGLVVLSIVMLCCLTMALTGCGKEKEEVEQNNKIVYSEGLIYELDSSQEFYILIGLVDRTDKNIIIPQTCKNLPVKEIRDTAFYGCSNLTNVEIPNSVTIIGRSAFYNCSRLTSVTIPNSVKSIWNDAFYNCYKLIEVINKSNLDITTGGYNHGYVGNYAKQIITDNSQSRIVEQNGFIFYNDNGTYYLMGYKGTDINLVLPNNINGNNYSIYKYAFYNCSSLTSIVIPNNVTSIGNYVFYGCSSLTSVVIGGSVTSIGERAFRGCSSLQSITIPNSVISIGDDAFIGCSSLTSVTIGDSVTSIGKYAFRGCSSLTSITIGDSVTSIGKYAFYNCSSLTSIVIPNSVTSIGERAFEYCYKLIEVINKSNLNITTGSSNHGYVGYYAKQVLTESPAVSNFIEKDDYVFYNDNGTYYLMGYKGTDTNLVLPNNINGNNYSINQYAFYGCSNITNIEIPNSVTSIGEYAFSGCSSLTSITIPNSVTSIGNGTFSGCSCLTSVTIGDSVTSIGEYAFSNCSSLASIVIGDSVTSIGNSAFRGCSSLESVTIGDSVTSIGFQSFYDCCSLEKVCYSGTIDQWAMINFRDYSSNPLCYAKHLYILNKQTNEYEEVTEVNITTATKISSYAFEDCTSLTSIVIGDSVTSIGNFAFYYCSSLTSIVFDDTTTWYRTTGFSNWNNKTGGTETDLTNPSKNATYFKDTYEDYYWYKI